MKEIEWRLISELMKNSRKSDRELARIIGVSKSTVTRFRHKLERNGIIKEYTVIPDFAELGYQIMALTLMKYRKDITKEEILKARKKAQKSMTLIPEMIMAERGLGWGYDGATITLHKDYSEYLEFKNWLKHWDFLEIPETQSFLIDFKYKPRYRPLTLSTLSHDLLEQQKKRE